MFKTMTRAVIALVAVLGFAFAAQAADAPYSTDTAISDKQAQRFGVTKFRSQVYWNHANPSVYSCDAASDDYVCHGLPRARAHHLCISRVADETDDLTPVKHYCYCSEDGVDYTGVAICY